MGSPLSRVRCGYIALCCWVLTAAMQGKNPLVSYQAAKRWPPYDEGREHDNRQARGLAAPLLDLAHFMTCRRWPAADKGREHDD